LIGLGQNQNLVDPQKHSISYGYAGSLVHNFFVILIKKRLPAFFFAKH